MIHLVVTIAIVAGFVWLQAVDHARDGWPARYKRQRADLSKVLPSRVWTPWRKS